jgi:hypothetical protein
LLIASASEFVNQRVVGEGGPEKGTVAEEEEEAVMS